MSYRSRGAILLFGVVSLLSVTALPVVAQPGPAGGPCAEDMKKFCPDAKPGTGQIVACMKEHEKDLSPACKAHQERVQANNEAFNNACGDDVKKHCSNMKAGGGRIMRCLTQKQAELSPTCKSYVEANSMSRAPRVPPAPKAVN